MTPFRQFSRRWVREGDGGYLGVVGGSGYPADDEADHYSVVGYLKYARSCSGVAEKSDSPTQ